MPRIEPITPHQFAGNILATQPACSDCGGAPIAPQHWNIQLLETLGPYAYHHWYYNRDIWRHVSFMGVYCAKNVLDLWNYQEIMWELKPGLVVEFGTYAGGTALYLAAMMTCVRVFGCGPKAAVLTVDIDWGPLHLTCIRNGSAVTPVKCRSIDSGSVIHDFRARVVGVPPPPMLCILDSDHQKENVLAELEMLRGLTRPGDYVIVEDSNINGHPVRPDFGPGPWEAIQEYERRYPGDYEHDTERENKFGMTFNPRGYMRRK